MVKSLLSEADAREVEAAVARVESQSAAEVVVAVLPQSADYWAGRVLLSVAWALGAGLAFLHFEPWREPMLALLVELLVGVVVFALSRWAPLQRWLVAPREAERAVNARAFQLFAERGLQGTRGRTALLIFVSELERRVVLLGDRTLDARLGQQGWDEHVARLLQHIRSGQARVGLLDVLERLAPQLAALAPREHDDENELPDAVLRS
jgi:putative membrane protein